jgi:hypothetical protein
MGLFVVTQSGHIQAISTLVHRPATVGGVGGALGCLLLATLAAPAAGEAEIETRTIKKSPDLTGRGFSLPHALRLCPPPH